MTLFIDVLSAFLCGSAVTVDLKTLTAESQRNAEERREIQSYN
jgi:hypothetical protein